METFFIYYLEKNIQIFRSIEFGTKNILFSLMMTLCTKAFADIVRTFIFTVQ